MLLFPLVLKVFKTYLFALLCFPGALGGGGRSSIWCWFNAGLRWITFSTRLLLTAHFWQCSLMLGQHEPYWIGLEGSNLIYAYLGAIPMDFWDASDCTVKVHISKSGFNYNCSSATTIKNQKLSNSKTLTGIKIILTGNRTLFQVWDNITRKSVSGWCKGLGGESGGQVACYSFPRPTPKRGAQRHDSATIQRERHSFVLCGRTGTAPCSSITYMTTWSSDIFLCVSCVLN